MTVLILAFLFSMAMGDSVGIHMAKSLGEGRAQGAAFVARLGIIVSVIGGVVIAGRAGGKLMGEPRFSQWVWINTY
jgi:Na+-driven multidrug efflux pump